MTPSGSTSPSRRTSIVRARRRRTGTAAAAYSHALALLGSPAEAASIAATALKRGAHSRTAALAHARHLVSSAANGAEDRTGYESASKDLRTLAAQLSHSRPIEERSIVDLQLRYGLDHGSFSRVLGVSSQRARGRAEETERNWAETLDPAMMASLGPGACDGLASVLTAAGLGSAPAPTGAPDALAATGTDTGAATASSAPHEATTPQVSTLLDVAPKVLAHAQTCDMCTQRLKLMTPVRGLVGQAPPQDVPDSVRDAARAARRALPTPLPPSIDADRIDVRRLRTIALVLLSVVLIAAAAFGIINAAVGAANSESQDDRVKSLIEAAPSASLLATPTIVTDDKTTISLANNSAQPILWNATTSAPWLTVTPTSGRLSPNQSVSIAIKAARTEPASITVAGSDGAKQTVRFGG